MPTSCTASCREKFHGSCEPYRNYRTDLPVGRPVRRRGLLRNEGSEHLPHGFVRPERPRAAGREVLYLRGGPVLPARYRRLHPGTGDRWRNAVRKHRELRTVHVAPGGAADRGSGADPPALRDALRGRAGPLRRQDHPADLEVRRRLHLRPGQLRAAAERGLSRRGMGHRLRRDPFHHERRVVHPVLPRQGDFRGDRTRGCAGRGGTGAQSERTGVCQGGGLRQHLAGRPHRPYRP